MAAGPSDEFASFVGGLVPLDEVQRGDAGPRFEDLMGRLTNVGGDGTALPGMIGGALLMVAAGLAAVMPAASTIEGSHFWRVAKKLGAEVAGAGNTASTPMLVGALLFLVAGLAAAYLARSDVGLPTVLAAVGAVALGLVILLWLALAALLLVNLVVLGLIVVAYIVGAVVALAIFFGMLAGLVNS